MTRPHVVLAGIAGAALLGELAARETDSSLWMLLAAILCGTGFVLVWRRQDELRLVPLLVLTSAFQLAWIAIHLYLDVTSFDSSELYRLWGNELLDGGYPDSQYPPGAVLLFGVDALLGGGPTRTSHALLMVPAQLATVWAVWSFKTWTTPWLAALVALWPLNAFFWEFRFDLVPTALLAAGLLFAYRERWALSGALLGVGTAVKWIPGVAFGILALWLLASRRRDSFGPYVAAFAAALLLLHVPFLLWDPGSATYAYRYFGDQGLTGESVWYLVLAPLGRATVDMSEFWLPADVPSWADPAAVLVQAALLGVIALTAIAVRSSVRSGIAVAAVGPVVFLLANRVFSPQYLVIVLAAWAIAGALVLETRREQLALGALAMAATAANAFVYPYTLYEQHLWRVASAAVFVLGFVTCAWLLVRAVALAPRGERTTAPASARGVRE